jgi:hypothetical protein
LSVPSRFNVGFAFANDLNMLDESRFNAGGLGEASLLDGLPVFAGFVFSFPFPKKSLALDGWEAVVSCLAVSLVSTGLDFVGCAFAGITVDAGGGWGRRPVLLLAFLLIIVPYFGANSMGSSIAQSSCISLVASERTCRSYWSEPANNS